jgi:hypothetical protein
MPVFQIRAEKKVQTIFVVTADTEKQAETIVWHAIENEPDRKPPLEWADCSHTKLKIYEVYSGATALYHD